MQMLEAALAAIHAGARGGLRRRAGSISTYMIIYVYVYVSIYHISGRHKLVD